MCTALWSVRVCVCACGCVCVCGCLTVQVLHIVQGMYVGNTVCTQGVDERKGVGVQEVRNKRKGTMWFIRLVQIWPITWRVGRLRKRRGSAQVVVRVDTEIDKMKEISSRRRRRRDKCSSGREFAVNNEKRLPRHAPGKTKPQPLCWNRLWHLKNTFNRFTTALKERDSKLKANLECESVFLLLQEGSELKKLCSCHRQRDGKQIFVAVFLWQMYFSSSRVTGRFSHVA